jgi:hypothetical protein
VHEDYGTVSVIKGKGWPWRHSLTIGGEAFHFISRREEMRVRKRPRETISFDWFWKLDWEQQRSVRYEGKELPEEEATYYRIIDIHTIKVFGKDGVERPKDHRILDKKGNRIISVALVEVLTQRREMR